MPARIVSIMYALIRIPAVTFVRSVVLRTGEHIRFAVLLFRPSGRFCPGFPTVRFPFPIDRVIRFVGQSGKRYARLEYLVFD